MSSGDDRAQLNVATSVSGVVAQVGNSGVPRFNSQQTSEMTQTLRLEGATLLTDQLQIGLGVPLVRSSFSTSSQRQESSTGLGDVRVSLGYEILPLWNYSVWRPQGYLFSVLTLPTGRSRYDSRLPTSTDITGNGFFSASLGSLWLKRWTQWDVFLVSELHYGFERSFALSDGESLAVSPGVGGSVGLGVGFSPPAFPLRIGLRLQPRWDQTRQVSSSAFLTPPALTPTSLRGLVTSTDTALDLAYMLGAEDTVMASYTDQTLLGRAQNTPLNRTLSVTYQHRWSR